ncbi:MAG: DUF4860 domain-containing protein [Clostridia bacterium]|nr:DUF4860 domain-containing protein [Clostridia bacterium]
MKKSHSYSVDTVFVLVLFCAFAATILFVLMSGANVYKDTAKIMQERYEERTCLSYISAKIKHYDNEDSVYLTDFNGVTALAMDEEINGSNYNTLIYYYDGHVKELFCEKGANLSAQSGTDIIDVKNLQFAKFDEDLGLIKIKCTGKSGGSSILIIGTKSENGGASNE